MDSDPYETVPFRGRSPSAGPAGPAGPASLLSSLSLSAADAPRFRPRACARCSTSKLKCSWLSEPGEAPCERCARTKAECVLPSLKPRGPRRGNPTRVGQLEQKIDGIMSLLTASKQIQQTSASTAASSSSSALAGGAPPPQPPTTATTTTRPIVPAVFVDTPPDLLQDSPSSTRGASAASAPSPESSSHSQAQGHGQLQPPERYAGNAPQGRTPASSASPDAAPSLSADVAPSQYSFYAPPPPPQEEEEEEYEAEEQQPPPPPSFIPRVQHLMRPPPLEHVEVAPGLKITFYDADLALAEYRRTYSPYFPFVPLAADVTAYELFQTQPFLFRVLLQVVLPQPAQMQRDAKRWLREQIAHHVVTEEEKSVPLLQAILLYVAWSDLGFYVDPKVTPLLQLAVGLVSDLGLHRPVHHEMSLALNAFIADASAALRGFGNERPAHTLQDMRAMLGCYYMCALSASFFRRIPALPFTSYMDQCCGRLLAAREYPSDALVVALARMHRLAARIYAVLPNPEPADAPALAVFAPIAMAMATIRQELDALVHHNSDLSENIKANCFLWTHYHALLMRLYEPAVYLKLQGTPVDLADAGLRTEALWNCLQATRDFFDAYAAVPTSVLGVLPLFGTAHLSFGIVTLTRLLSLDDPEWHIGQARRSLDFVGLALQLERQFQAAEEHENALAEQASSSPAAPTIGRKKRYITSENRTILAAHRDKMRWIRIWYTTKMPPDPHQAGPHQSTMAGRPSGQLARNPVSPPVPPVSSATLPYQQPLPFPFQAPEPQLQPQPQSQPPPSSLMDVDTEKLVLSPSGLAIPPDEFDSTFWKAIFDLDGSWEPMSQ